MVVVIIVSPGKTTSSKNVTRYIQWSTWTSWQHEHFLTQKFGVVFHPCGKLRPASMAFWPQPCCCCSASFIHHCHLMPCLPLASRSPVWKQRTLWAACYKQTGRLVHRLRIHGNLPLPAWDGESHPRHSVRSQAWCTGMLPNNYPEVLANVYNLSLASAGMNISCLSTNFIPKHADRERKANGCCGWNVSQILWISLTNPEPTEANL